MTALRSISWGREGAVADTHHPPPVAARSQDGDLNPYLNGWAWPTPLPIPTSVNMRLRALTRGDG